MWDITACMASRAFNNSQTCLKPLRLSDVAELAKRTRQVGRAQCLNISAESTIGAKRKLTERFSLVN